MELWLSIILFIIGLAILIKGCEFFVSGAAFIARHFGVSELIIGLTLVSMGTSLPEFGASVYASYNGDGGIAVGNVVGSNVANIALVLGVCLMLRRIRVKKVMLKRDGLIMLGVSLLFIFLVIDGVGRLDGLVLMILFAVYIVFLYRQNKTEARNPDMAESSERFSKKGGKPGKEIAKLIIGCLAVISGAKLLVDSSVDIASTFGISDTVIGSTLIAFSTSVPELAVSLMAILKRYEDISIGNIIGSNIFNILWVIGAAAIVGELAVDNTLLYINLPIMLCVAALLLIFMAIKNRLEKWEGGVFLAIYVVFLVLNYM
ncbi:MAG: calcium/sodium antiporter [Thermoplasmata archaeon]